MDSSLSFFLSYLNPLNTSSILKMSKKFKKINLTWFNCFDPLLVLVGYLLWFLLLHTFVGLITTLNDMWVFFQHFADFFLTQSGVDVSDCIERDDRKNFCLKRCPPSDKPDDYARCRRYDKNNIIYANSVIYCWVLCQPQMYKWARESVAWWEFWIKKPSDAEIADFKQRSIEHARKCIRDSYNHEISSTNSMLERYVFDTWHNWAFPLLIFLFIVTSIALLIMLFKKVID